MPTVIICAGVLILLLVLGVGISLCVTGKMSPRNVGLLVFGTISLLTLEGGCAIVWNNYLFAQKAVSAQGEVFRVGESSHQDSSGQWLTDYAPHVRFVTSQERTIEFIGPVSNSRGYTQGERVEVLYLPDKPETAHISGFDRSWLVAAGLFFFAVVFGGITLRALFRKESPEQASSLRLVSSRNRRKAAVRPLS